MQTGYLDTKKPSAHNELSIFAYGFAIEDATVQILAGEAHVSGTDADSIATWVVVLRHLLRAYDACLAVGPSYGYTFGAADRARVLEWSARYPSYERHQKDARYHLARLPTETVPVDTIAQAVFAALHYVVTRR